MRRRTRRGRLRDNHCRRARPARKIEGVPVCRMVRTYERGAERGELGELDGETSALGARERVV